NSSLPRARALPGHQFDDVEAVLSGPQTGYHEPPPFVGRVGLFVTPPAEGHQAVQIEIRPSLRALYHVMHVEPPPDAARLAAPAGSAQALRSDGRPFGPTGRLATERPRASSAHAPTRAEADRRSPRQHGAVPRFCPRGQKWGTSRGSASPRTRRACPRPAT